MITFLTIKNIKDIPHSKLHVQGLPAVSDYVWSLCGKAKKTNCVSGRLQFNDQRYEKGISTDVKGASSSHGFCHNPL